MARNTQLFHYKEITTKKPGVSNTSIVPNEFSGCMIYGRYCTGCDGARQA